MNKARKTEPLNEALSRFDLSGRVAIVTGASSGLGKSIVRTLAAAGADVALVARRKDRLTKVASEIDGLADRLPTFWIRRRLMKWYPRL